EHRPRCFVAEVSEERAADASALAAGPHVRVPDEVHVPDRLDPHDADQLPVLLEAPEGDAGRDLAVELGGVHVGLVPAVLRDRAAVGLGGGVHDREDGRPVGVIAPPDHAGRLGTSTLRRNSHTISPRWFSPTVSTVTTPRSGFERY